MLNLSDPRGNGRKEVKNTVENSTWESNVAFSEGAAVATAVNAAIKPMMVPSSPIKVEIFAKVPM